jgi:hypothetical protein
LRHGKAEMAYENTEVPVARSQEVIRKLIMGNKGMGVMFWSKPPREGFEAYIPWGDATYHIRIQAEVKANRRDKDQEYAVRRIWRVLYYHMKAIYENAASGVMEFREMMLPYIVTADGQTVAERILPFIQKAIDADPMKMLPAPRDAHGR